METANRQQSKFLTVGEAARALGISADRVRQLERSNVLPALRTETGVRLFERTVIEEFWQRREKRHCKV